jgi:hypothetical protein
MSENEVQLTGRMDSNNKFPTYRAPSLQCYLTLTPREYAGNIRPENKRETNTRKWLSLSYFDLFWRKPD